MKAEQQEIMKLGDIWARLYYHLARELIEGFGVRGESALRRGIRRFGRERGLSMRAQHTSQGLDINLKSLFQHYDLPPDPRTGRITACLSESERISQTTACPYADMWLCYPRGDELGRIYCEEVHHAIFSAYDEAVQTNLTDTITQGHETCRFAVYLRPANRLGSEQVVQAEDSEGIEAGDLARMFNMLILLYFYLARELVDQFGQPGQEALRQAIRSFGRDRGLAMRREHESQGLEINLETLMGGKDLPSEPRTESEILGFTAREWAVDVKSCGFYEDWKRRGGLDVGLVYCQEVHHAMWESYDPQVEVNLPQSLTAGDCRCVFRVYWKDPGDKEEGKRPGSRGLDTPSS